ncbi:hypothetical protein C0Q70_12539 [Pomacea canaliculata]|uniref:Glyoxylate reductase/hydroxypyruvate reductase n=1 Tax=Pomacea canaliculata TaxID=400727 RepID=A0A2T7P1T7_POMCA|nr:hypothetical protein C0Q70_12539 [Pomacea canaliculata]
MDDNYSIKPVVFITSPFEAEEIRRLEATCDVRWLPGAPHPLPRDVLLKNVRDVHGLIIWTQDRVDAELLDAAGPQLRVIGTVSVGLDHIDLKECQRRGVSVGYTPGVLTAAVAELTVTLLLMTIRNIQQALHGVRSGSWFVQGDLSMDLMGGEVSGSVVGIVGLGSIGLAVATRLKAFQPARIIYCSSSNTPKAGASLHRTSPTLGKEAGQYGSEKSVSQSDIVIATCSMNRDSNNNLFNAAAFASMRSSSVFINVSRGALVDQEALVSALSSGQIAAAGVDVTSPEPLPPDHPMLQLPNLTVLPHLGWATRRACMSTCHVTVDNILAGLQGHPLPSPVP